MIKIITLVIGLTNKIFAILVLFLACSGILFVAYKANQPMQVAEAPKGMTYFEFLDNRINAAKIMKPARCGTGMIGSLFALGPFYATLYTHVTLNPGGFLAKVTAPDPDLPKGIANARWYQVPGIWWNTFEKLSWTMLAKPHQGCRFPPVMGDETRN